MKSFAKTIAPVVFLISLAVVVLGSPGTVERTLLIMWESFGIFFAPLVGASFGLIIADADQNLPVIKHRSILTHGPLWPMFMGREPISDPIAAHFMIGFFIGYALHLNFDMFPKQWVGIAKIHLYGKVRLNGILSFLWLAAGAISSLWLAASLISQADTYWGLWGGPLLIASLFIHKIKKSDEKVVGPAFSLILMMIGLGVAFLADFSGVFDGGLDYLYMKGGDYFG